MPLLLKLAWRNLFRNPRRTVISGLAIGMGLAVLIILDAFIIGEMNTFITTATAIFPGQAQIHHQGFRQTQDIENVITEPGRVIKDLLHEPGVKAFAPRVVSSGMLSSAADVSGVRLYGVDSARERAVSRLSQALQQGRFLDPDEPNTIYIGNRLAQNLSVGLGDRVVLTVAQARTGELSQEMFRVGGIFSLGVREMDSALAFINLAKAQQLLQIGDNVHEIAIVFNDLQAASNADWSFWKRYSQGGNEAVGWGRLFPDLASVVGIMHNVVFISALILFGIVSFGILNTLFMSLYERMFEFGVLRAIGTRPVQVAGILFLEACCLAAVSIVIGDALGWGVCSYFAWVGIDLRGLAFSGVTFQDPIYPVVQPIQYIKYPLWLFGFTALIGLYPAIYAARLLPAKAMKRSL